jgi:hypothetical protein
MEHSVDVAGFVEARRDGLIATAQEGVARAHLGHYEAAGAEATQARVRALIDVLIGSCRDHHLDGAVSYAAALADDRQSGGYPLVEVQTVINVTEEAVWKSILADTPTDQQGYALALVSTVLGAVKDALAQGYLAHVGSHIVRLHVESLFSGTEGTARPL